MLIKMAVEFFKDKLRNAVMFCFFSLLSFGIWFYLNDEGALVAGVLLAGISAQQFHKYYLQRREFPESPD
jgi:hypothetical protein